MQDFVHCFLLFSKLVSKKKYKLLLLSFFSIVLVNAQDKESDLRRNLESKIDSVRLNSYYKLGKFYAETTGKGDSAIYYGDKAIQYSKTKNNTDDVIGGFSLKGYGYAVNKDFKSAKTYLEQGLVLAKKQNNKKRLSEIYTRLAAVHENLDQPVESIEHYIESIKYADEIKDLRILALSYYGVSVIYSKQDQFDKQLNYLRNAIELCSNGNLNASTRNIILSSASQQFSALSRREGYAHYKDSSLVYAVKALEVSKDHGLVQSIPSNLLSISIHYLNLGLVDQSLQYATDALSYSKTMKEDTKLNLFQILAHIYRAKNEKQECYIFLDSLNSLSLKDKPYYGSIISKYRHYTFKFFEDHDLAYKALDEYFQFENQKKEVEQNKTINELETKYQVQLKENKIKKLTYWLIASIAIGLLGFLIYYIHRLRVSRRKNSLLKEAIKQQIAFEKELVNVRNNIAQDFHDDLGNKLARISLLTALVEDELTDANESIKDRISRVKEDSVSLYVGTKDFIFSLKPDSDKLEELVTYLIDFGEDFFQDASLKFIVSKQVDENVKLPHYWTKQLIFIFKEAMTNALKHANATEIKLHFECRNNNLKVTCQDNGKGFVQENSTAKNGLFNMKTRAEKIGGLLQIISEEGKGTTISFHGEISKK